MNKENDEVKYSLDEGRKNRRTGLSVKHANIFFLCYTVLALGLSAVKFPGIPTTWISLLYYIPVLFIAALLCRMEKKRLGDAFGFHRAKPATLLLTVVICYAMHSVSHLISSLTNLLFPSFFAIAGNQLLGDSFLVSFIGVAIIPALFEEFVVRGGMLNSYLGAGRQRSAILLTAFLFGLMHMNPTQFFYCFIMGIVLALLFVLTDSIWPGILFHFINNAMAPISILLEDRYGEAFVSRYIFPFSRGLTDLKSTMITVTAAIAGLVITALCLRAAARFEGSEDLLRLCIQGDERKEKIITLPLIIAIVIMAVMTAAVGYSLVMHITPGQS